MKKNILKYFRSSNTLLFCKYKTDSRQRKSRNKIEESQKDLNQRITDCHDQNDAEREKAFMDPIVEIIVQATLREYYETKKSIEI